MVRSCESPLTAMFDAGAIFAGAAAGCGWFAVDDVAAPVVEGAVTPGRLACDGCTGGLGPKYLAHRIITPKESNDAARIRSSGVNLSFCPGALMSPPLSLDLSLRLNSLASLPFSPEPDRNQICARVAGSAA